MSADRYAKLLAGVALYKGVELTLLAWMPIGLLLAAAAVFMWWRPRLGSLAVSLSTLLVLVSPWYRNHLVLLFWLTLTVALFPRARQQQFVLRSQLSIMYGFAALAKLHPDWLSGSVLEARAWIAGVLPDPLVVVVAVVVVTAEAVFAVAVWSSSRRWWFAALLLHLGFVLATQTGPWDIGRLTVFAILSLGTWWWSLDRSARAIPDRPVGVAPP